MENTEENLTPAETSPEDVPAKKNGRIRRILKRVLIAALAIFALLIIVIAFFLGPIVGFVANTFGASLLGVDKCAIGSATIYPFGGYVRFENVEIGKPISQSATFSKNLFSVELLEIDVDMFSLLSQKKILDRLEIRKISANYEQAFSGETNVNAVLENVLGESVPADEVPEEEIDEPIDESDADDVPAEEIFVGARYFVIEDVRVAAFIRGVPVVFPPMSSHFEDGVGIDEDLSPVAFGVKVAGNFMSVIDFFRRSALGDAAGVAFGAVSDAASATKDSAKAAAGATVDFVSGAASFTGDAAGNAAGAVGDAAGAVFKFFRGADDESSSEEK